MRLVSNNGANSAPVRVLNAMHRPEDLFDSVENDAVTRLLSLVVCGETAVVGRMPIFGRDDEIEALLQFICKRDDLITVRHRLARNHSGDRQ